ncbi:unnamed protein product [Nesidiocoris tenuis]|uniref:Uncharacterized protein n=1 Tax=Nesidiocoris tenuis TaxID=355587 RepID=A0A6H5H5X8_9HEMI|nr:unnamed protein product [Nesidiocoris tenuis]
MRSCGDTRSGEALVKKNPHKPRNLQCSDFGVLKNCTLPDKHINRPKNEWPIRGPN